MPAIDLDSWPRRAIHDYFLGFDDPWFSLCAEVEAGPTWDWCKASGAAFSLACWWAVLRATDDVPAFRQRLRDGGVWEHERLRMGVTALKPDQAFTYAYFDDAPDFARFVVSAKAELEARFASSGLDPEVGRDDLLHGTVVPWVRFTGLKHARASSSDGSVPKIALGRASAVEGGRRLPVSVEGHHSLIDGVHVGAFLRALEARLVAPSETFGDPPAAPAAS